MEISPGVEIVWNLAAAETRAARMKEIEPDHFFCGLLKFAEMDEKELQSGQVPQLLIEALRFELERVRVVLAERSIDTAFVRREIRRVMEQGFLRPPEGEAIHRSDASRQLFERASRAAVQTKGIVDSGVLLQTLLSRPTRAMTKVLGKVGDTEVEAKDETGPVAVPPNRFVQEMPAMTEEQAKALPAVTQPQVQVLAWALRRPNTKPICLICTGKIDVAGLLQNAAQKDHPRIHLLQISTSDLLKGVKKTGAVVENIGEVINRASGSNNTFVFFDTTGLKLDKAGLLFKSLAPVIESSGVRLIFAIPVGMFNQVVDELQMDGLFQEIWLHELKEARLPHQL